MIKVCEHCGVHFRAKGRKGKYCSPECYRAGDSARRAEESRRIRTMACAHCGREFMREAGEMSRRYCGWECARAARAEADRARMASQICSVEGCGRGAPLVGGVCRRCYQARMVGRHAGVCRHCGKEFVSRDKGKKFCSIACYNASDYGAAVVAKAREESARARGVVIGARVVVQCLQCGKDKELYPSYARGRDVKTKRGLRRKHRAKFCSRLCARQWMAERFDRAVANPETVALPQCYDEFLSKEILPCLVDGCDWEGHNLSTHMNQSHGITKEEFKELAGFNAHTGVVSAPLQRILADVNAGRGDPNFGECGPKHGQRPGFRQRHEALEHVAKAQALMDRSALAEGARRYAEEHPEEKSQQGRAAFEKLQGRTTERVCRHCGGSFLAPALSTNAYCGEECRREGKRKTQARARARYEAKREVPKP